MPKTTEKNKYFVVRERAVPEVLLNVVAAKKLLESKRAATVQEAADAVGISRSSFYKYKDDIFPFHEEAKGKTITFIIQMDDEPEFYLMFFGPLHRIMKYSDHTSEYSHKWNCHTYLKCTDPSGRGRCQRR